MEMVQKITDDVYLEAIKEECCIEDCLEVVKIYMKNGDYNLAFERCNDIKKSLKKLDSLQRKMSIRKTVIQLNQHNVNVEVVNRDVH